MKNRLLIEDGEKKDILSQHDDIDPKIFNFLMRRIKIIERELGSNNWEDTEPLKVKEYRFEGFPGYGFTGYMSKKDMEKSIIIMLYENDVTDYIYDMNENDPERKKIIKTIRKFLNFILIDQK
jgi:hypothetical protein